MEKSLNLTSIIALVTGFLLLGGAIWPEVPLRDAVTMLPASGFDLEVSWAYLIFTPLFNILDLMTSLSLTQHVAWVSMLCLLGFFLYFRCLKKFTMHVFFRGAIAVVLTFICIAGLYALAMLFPRPMSMLVVPEENMLVVDFHSHTNASHDANTSFDAEDNRNWHKGSGFDAVFVTDHSTFKGIQEGKLNNTKLAADGVQLMDGVEVFHKGGHVLALCAVKIMQEKGEYLWQDNDNICSPMLVQALPAPIDDSNQRFQAREIMAIEINDGAPLGLEEIKHRDVLREKAKSLNIAVVSGSDNHGWAYAATGWSILRIENWQAMNADQLALAITSLIRSQGFTSVQVIERNMLTPATSMIGHIIMPLRLLGHMFQSISLAERFSWLIWLMVGIFLTRVKYVFHT